MGRKKLDPATSVTRQRILEAASRLFVRKGYHTVSMDAVAEAAPVSKRTLYNHFSDKNALFQAVIQNRCGQLSAKLERSLQDYQDAEEALTKVGQQFLATVLAPDGINLYRTLLTESQQFPELGKLFYESGPARTRKLLTEYLQHLHDRDVLRVPDPELASGMFIGMLFNRIHMQCLIGLKKQVSAKEINAIVAYAVTLFLRGHSR